MAKKKVTQIVEEILEPYLAENGYELYNTEFVKEGRDWFLKVYIDRPVEKEDLGIGTDDCEFVSRYLSEALDRTDPIEQNYYLVVSSPGMDRVLLRDRDYQRHGGKPVVVSLYQAMDGTKTIHGILESRDEYTLTLMDEKGERISLPREKVAKVRLAVIF